MTNKRTMTDARNRDESPQRDRRLNVPLSDEEKQEVRMSAARAGKSMAQYVRDQLFGEKTEAVPA